MTIRSHEYMTTKIQTVKTFPFCQEEGIRKLKDFFNEVDES